METESTEVIYSLAMSACDGNISAVERIETIVANYVRGLSRGSRMAWHVFQNSTPEQHKSICARLCHCKSRRAALAVFSLLDEETFQTYLELFWRIDIPEVKNNTEFFTEVLRKMWTMYEPDGSTHILDRVEECVQHMVDQLRCMKWQSENQRWY